MQKIRSKIKDDVQIVLLLSCFMGHTVFEPHLTTEQLCTYHCMSSNNKIRGGLSSSATPSVKECSPFRWMWLDWLNIRRDVWDRNKLTKNHKEETNWTHKLENQFIIKERKKQAFGLWCMQYLGRTIFLYCSYWKGPFMGNFMVN